MRKYILPLILTIIFAVVYSYCFDAKLDINGDNATYIKLAENISHGLGYSVDGVNGLEPASHFPPGYSFILSIFITLGINNLIFFKVLNGLFLLISLLLLYRVVSGITDNRALGFSSVLLVVFSPKVLNFAYMAMSEMSFLFTAALVIYALYKYSEKSSFLRSPYFYLAIAAAAGGYYIRSVGASLIFAIMVFYAFRREWKELAVSVGGIVLLLLPWYIRNSVMGLESRYLGTVMTVNPWRPEEGSISTIGEMANKMVHNFDETVIKSFKSLLFPFMETNFREPSSFLMILFGLAILAVVLYGAWNFGKLRWFMLAFLVANIGLFLLWHGGNGERYVVPITPFIFICFWVGIFFLIRLKLKLKYSPYLFLVIILPMFSAVAKQTETSRLPYPPAFENYFKMAIAIDKQVPRKTVICCRKPELMCFYAKKIFALNYAYTLDDKELVMDLVNRKVDYVVLDNLGFASTSRYLYPAIEKNQELFTPVMVLRNPDTYLLKFEKEKAIEKFNK